MINIVCVYRSGGPVYNEEYVRRLSQSVYKNSGIKLTCISDDPIVGSRLLKHNDWFGWWSKMEMFDPTFFSNEGILYFDLDTVISNDLTDIIKACKNSKDTPIMLQDFFYKDKLASGVMWLPYKFRVKVWTEFLNATPSKVMQEYEREGDQGFISKVIGKYSKTWQKECPGSIASYKKDIIQKTPTFIKAVPLKDFSKVSVICYHGKPRPHETNWDSVGLINA